MEVRQNLTSQEHLDLKWHGTSVWEQVIEDPSVVFSVEKSRNLEYHVDHYLGNHFCSLDSRFLRRVSFDFSTLKAYPFLCSHQYNVMKKKGLELTRLELYFLAVLVVGLRLSE